MGYCNIKEITTGKFQVGARVTRPVDVFKPEGSTLHGVVIKAYSQHHSKLGFYAEVYDVRWDSEGEDTGFLPHGIQKEEE